jgi:hypothetical protein
LSTTNPTRIGPGTSPVTEKKWLEIFSLSLGIGSRVGVTGVKTLDKLLKI